MLDLNRLRILRELKQRGTLAAVALALPAVGHSVVPDPRLRTRRALRVRRPALPRPVGRIRARSGGAARSRLVRPAQPLRTGPPGGPARTIFLATRSGADHHPAITAKPSGTRKVKPIRSPDRSSPANDRPDTSRRTTR